MFDSHGPSPFDDSDMFDESDGFLLPLCRSVGLSVPLFGRLTYIRLIETFWPSRLHSFAGDM